MCSIFKVHDKVDLRLLDQPIQTPNRKAGDPKLVRPTDRVIALFRSGKAIETRILNWGFHANWTSKSASRPKPIFNARIETVAIKPTFRAAFQWRRCLIPFAAWYEFTRVVTEIQPGLAFMPVGDTRETIHPVQHTVTDQTKPCFAGLWEGETCTILTCTANAVAEKYHDRMPVILDEEHWEEWLDPKASPDDLGYKLQPYPAEKTVAKTLNTKRLI